MLNRIRPALCVLALTLAAAALWPATPGYGHGDEEHEMPDLSEMPKDDFVLSDAMRLMNLSFQIVDTQGASIDTDPKAQKKVIRATNDAQRYLRTAVRRWAPDADFPNYADRALSAWQTLERAALEGDPAALEAGKFDLEFSCKACHNVYRNK